MKKNILILFIPIISIQVGLSQTIDTLKLNNYFQSLDSNNKFMGSVV
jgi:D-alanyl-D-alanine carboxypeptidase